MILIVKSSFALPTSLTVPTSLTRLTGPTLLMALLVTLSGCGQTGPLYMPNKPVGHGAHRAPAGATAPGTRPAATTAPIQLSPPAPAAGVTMPAANSNSNNTEATNQIPAQLPAQPPQATQQ